MSLPFFPVRPQSVKILRKEKFLTEGVKVQIVCEVRKYHDINFCGGVWPESAFEKITSIFGMFLISGARIISYLFYIRLEAVNPLLRSAGILEKLPQKIIKCRY